MITSEKSKNNETRDSTYEECYICGSRKTKIVIKKGIDYEYGMGGDFNLFECCHCGLIRLLPRPCLDTIKSFYPSHYHSYQRPSNFLFKLLSNINLNKKKKRYGVLIGNSGTILDVGSGDGQVMEALQGKGKYVCYGIEFKKDIVEMVRKKGLNIFYGTLENIGELKDNFFDLIIMNHLIEHVENPYNTLMKAHRLLKKDGWICGETPNSDCIERKIFRKTWAGFHIPRHLQLFSFKNISQLFKKAGFSKIVVKKSLNPGQWALSMQNAYVRRFPKTKLVNGKTWIYPLFLFLSVLIVIFEKIFLPATGIMSFEARK